MTQYGRPRKVKRATGSVRQLASSGDNTSRKHLTVSYPRPRTRGECVDGHRPCPYVSCKYHLYLDVTDRGALRLNFPDIEPHEMWDSCVLDLADRDGMLLREIGAAMNVTNSRIGQIEVDALAKITEEELLDDD